MMIYRVNLTEEDIELIKVALNNNATGSIFNFASIPTAERTAANQRVKQVTEKLDAAEPTQVRS